MFLSQNEESVGKKILILFSGWRLRVHWKKSGAQHNIPSGWMHSFLYLEYSPNQVHTTLLYKL